MVPRELASSALGFLHRSIRVAFIGHRPNQLPEEALARVRAAIEAALESLEAAGKEAASRNVKFVLVTALAEGADRIAAEVALARGWALEAPLPFSIERYEKDFSAPDSIAAFQGLLKKAEKVRPAPQNDAKPELAYAAAGRAVIRGADAALIVWNGDDGKGPGGTADMAARALRAGAPVVWIGVAARQRSKLIMPEATAERRGARATYMRGALAARFERTERPASLQADTG
jgi:nitroreductase